jgi:hypothetical protein
VQPESPTGRTRTRATDTKEAQSVILLNTWILTPLQEITTHMKREKKGKSQEHILVWIRNIHTQQ